MVYSHMSLARLYTLLGRIADAEHEIAQAAEIPAVGPHRVWQLEDAIFLAYATGRYADGRRDMESALAASPEPDRDATLWWSLLKAIGGEADRADAARRRRRSAEVEEAVAAGRRFADVLRRSANAAIEADGAGPMVRAQLRSADAEESRLEGRPDPDAVGGRRRGAESSSSSRGSWRMRGTAMPRRSSRAAVPPIDAARPIARRRTPSRASWARRRSGSPIEALASRARIQLESQPDSVGPAVKRPASALTARELEVLALVAAGHTNREIGDRLFISEKTASVHVTHAMNKLGALSRYEAAATATRLGLLEPARGALMLAAGRCARNSRGSKFVTAPARRSLLTTIGADATSESRRKSSSSGALCSSAGSGRSTTSPTVRSPISEYFSKRLAKGQNEDLLTGRPTLGLPRSCHNA